MSEDDKIEINPETLSDIIQDIVKSTHNTSPVENLPKNPPLHTQEEVFDISQKKGSLDPFLKEYVKDNKKFLDTENW